MFAGVKGQIDIQAFRFLDNIDPSMVLSDHQAIQQRQWYVSHTSEKMT